MGALRFNEIAAQCAGQKIEGPRMQSGHQDELTDGMIPQSNNHFSNHFDVLVSPASKSGGMLLSNDFKAPVKNIGQNNNSSNTP